ncbi:MAG: TerC family protein [Polyangiaceae bacterium]|nr:TerC family protein [Polyangiaceae bacterium]
MPDLSPFLHPDGWITLATLSALEIVLGIDNIVFLSIMVARLPPRQQPAARRIGLVLALAMRLLLLLTISWVMSLKAGLFTVFGRTFSGRDLILLGGGLFLLAKSTHEMFDKLEVEHEEKDAAKKGRSAFVGIVVQIMLLDIVFSLDSVITAVGMAKDVVIMVMAMFVAMGVMLVFAGAIGAFIEKHPSMKILALSFLLLIGVVLIADGMGQHISKGYIYFAMAFSLGVELVNMRLRLRQRAPVHLHARFEKAGAPASSRTSAAPPESG